jgi:hypothetical protein
MPQRRLLRTICCRPPARSAYEGTQSSMSAVALPDLGWLALRSSWGTLPNHSPKYRDLVCPLLRSSKRSYQIVACSGHYFSPHDVRTFAVPSSLSDHWSPVANYRAMHFLFFFLRAPTPGKAPPPPPLLPKLLLFAPANAWASSVFRSLATTV